MLTLQKLMHLGAELRFHKKKRGGGGIVSDKEHSLGLEKPKM